MNNDEIYFACKNAILNSKTVKETKEQLDKIFTTAVIVEMNQLNEKYQYKGMI